MLMAIKVTKLKCTFGILALWAIELSCTLTLMLSPVSLTGHHRSALYEY